MIEIRITIEAALSLLLERMRLELNLRQRCGLISKGLRLEDLNYKELMKIVEASLFDTVFLLPVDIILLESNLVYILTETVKALSRIFKKEEFSLFNSKKAKKLIKPIIKYLTTHTKDDSFKNN